MSVVNTLDRLFLSVGALVSIYLIVINGGSLGNQPQFPARSFVSASAGCGGC